MKNILRHFILLSLGILACAYFSMPAYSQSAYDDFSSEIYRKAIENIAEASGGKLDRERILKILDNQLSGNATLPGNITMLRGDTIYMVPEIFLAHYDNTHVTFDYFPVETFHLDSLNVSFPESPDWVNTADIVIDSVPSSITIEIEPNDTIAPRQTSVILRGIINSDTVYYTAYILQQPRPQQFIFVSPKYQAMAPEGGVTDPFTVTHFNVAELDVIIDQEDDWVWVNEPTDQSDQISFVVSANDDTMDREAVIIVSEKDNIEISDTLTIFQFVDTAAYIIVNPASSFISSGATNVDVAVNSNIDWKMEFDAGNPAGMISNTIINQDSTSISFTISNNASPSRTAIITLSDTLDLGVSAEIKIIQSAASPSYLSVSPENSYVGSEAGTVTLNVETNVSTWDYVLDVSNPADMLTFLSKTDTTITFTVDTNNTATSRTGMGRIVDVDNPELFDNFNIIQQASYILLDPDSKLVQCEGGSFGVNVTRYNVDSIYVDGASFLSVAVVNMDSLYITVPENPNNTSRSDTLLVCDKQNQEICDTLYIFQYACSESYILLSPREQFVNWDQDSLTVPVVITSQNVETLVDSSSVDWIHNINIANDTLTATIDENPEPVVRDGYIYVFDDENDNTIDSVRVIQGSSLDFIAITPEYRTVSYTGGITDPFTIVKPENVDVWEVFPDPPADWINITFKNGESLRFVAAQNDSIAPRQTTFTVRDSLDHSIFDTAIIFQDGAPLPFLFASPREQKVIHSGADTVSFTVSSANIDGWYVDTLSIDTNWVHLNDPAAPDKFSLKVDTNLTFQTRIDSIWVVAINKPLVRDTVIIYQYSAQDHYLLAAPREQETDYEEDTLHFDVTAVNLTEAWEVEIITGSTWIETLTYGNDSLSLRILKNNTLGSLQGSVRIYSDEFTDAVDTIYVYQYAAPDSLLIAAPRERLISHEGDSTVIFDITAVNFTEWDIVAGTLPDWIHKNVPHNLDTLSLKVDPNPEDTTRYHTIWIEATDNPAINDTVRVFQYSNVSSYVLIAPREQSIDFVGDTLALPFVVTTNRVEEWDFIYDETSTSMLDTVWRQGNSMIVVVDTNNTFETRHTWIRAFDTMDNTIHDSVQVFQSSAQDHYLLASPREQQTDYQEDTLHFDVTAVNLTEDWKVDILGGSTWIETLTFGNDSLSLRILKNNTFESRQDSIRIFSEQFAEAADTIYVYQYSRPDSLLLVAPRERRIAHTGNDSVVFEVTTANFIDWNVDTSSMQAWVHLKPSPAQGKFRLDVEANDTTFQTRIDTVWVESTTNAGIRDSILIYQYSAVSPYVLIAPREQEIDHIGGELPLPFVVTTNLVDEWDFSYDTSDTSMLVSVTRTQQGLGDSLIVVVDTNYTFNTRQTWIYAFDAADNTIRDSVEIFQSSNVSPYILIAPREQTIGIIGDTLDPFVITKHLVDKWAYSWDNSPGSMLKDVWQQGNLLMVEVDTNLLNETRETLIIVWDTANSITVRDTVKVVQESNSDPYIILSPAADSLRYNDTSFYIKYYSNFDIFHIEKEANKDWYTISDSIGSYNDSIELTIDENTSNYLSRSSYITFRSADDSVVKYFFFWQQKKSNDFVCIKGTILVDGEPGVPVVDIHFGDSTTIVKVLESDSGAFIQRLQYGWVGSVTPQIVQYQYEPSSWVFEEALESDTIIEFNAIPINPKITFNIDNTFICARDTLKSGAPDYPIATTDGTYGEKRFWWSSSLPDPNINPFDTTSTIRTPNFTPIDTTDYILWMSNFEKTVSDTFTLCVHAAPIEKDFDGPLTVCRNQAGVIYTVNNYNPNDTLAFSWELEPSEGGRFVTSPNSNIAIIDWENEPGNYKLSLTTYSKLGCSQLPFVDTIVVTSSESPPKAIVKKKLGDNMLLCSDSLGVDLYEWGWYTIADGQLGDEYIIPGKNDWYCRLPHEFNPIEYYYFVITHYDGPECSSRSFYNAPVGIDEVAATDDIFIFPNPTDGAVNIRFNDIVLDRLATLELLNISGRMVYQKSLEDVQTNTTITIDETRYLKPGIYFIRVRSKNIIYNSKIVVQ